MKNIVISIYRYNIEENKDPYMQNFSLYISKYDNPMVLTLLEKIKEEQDPTVSFRRSCREGVCGSDGMNINGVNMLACITPISKLKTNKIVLRPLPSFPVKRDLIVDLSQFYEQYKKIEPYLQNNKTIPKTENLQTPKDRKKLDGLYECILCACCTSSCFSYWWNMDKFLGPAALLQVKRFIEDSRDTESIRRLNNLKDHFSLFRCRSIMNCVKVCQKGLNPMKAISEIRIQMLKQKL